MKLFEAKSPSSEALATKNLGHHDDSFFIMVTLLKEEDSSHMMNCPGFTLANDLRIPPV